MTNTRINSNNPVRKESARSKRFATVDLAVVRFRRWIGLGIAAGIIAAVGHSGAEQLAGAQNDLDGLIQTFVQTPPRDRGIVEHLLGAKLALTKSTDWLDIYTADDVGLADVTIKQAEYRIPKQSKEGQLLILTLDGRCISNKEIFSRYKNMVPGRGGSDALGWLQDWGESLPWGRLSFGFNTSTGCLHDVVILVTSKV